MSCQTGTLPAPQQISSGAPPSASLTSTDRRIEMRLSLFFEFLSPQLRWVVSCKSREATLKQFWDLHICRRTTAVGQTHLLRRVRRTLMAVLHFLSQVLMIKVSAECIRWETE